MKYSVLMSVYYKENHLYFEESINSLLMQTVLPNEIVIVKDGPLTKELDLVIDKYKKNSIFKIISLDKNIGLGQALNIGIKACSNNLIARMDTDDISMPSRCQEQIEYFKKNPYVSVIGTASTEFLGNPNLPIVTKEVKETYLEIKKAMKYRNAMNHPTVMFKKNDVLAAGNYEHFLYNEDYFLWIRMMKMGFIFNNINKPLVKVRITNDTYLRRGGWQYFITQKRLFDYMLDLKMINVFEYICKNFIGFVMRILIPNKFRKFIYLNLLRKKLTDKIV